MEIENLLEQAALEARIICPGCGSPLEPDCPKCGECGWENPLIKWGYI